MRQRLERREGEWEGRVAELETDVQQLKCELEKHKLQLREADRDKTRSITELSEQNHSLLEQLSRVSALFHILADGAGCVVLQMNRIMRSIRIGLRQLNWVSVEINGLYRITIEWRIL